MLKKMILFSIRMHLGVKKNQLFSFKNQANKENRYFINEKGVYKLLDSNGHFKASNISMHFLLSGRCQYQMIKYDEVFA